MNRTGLDALFAGLFAAIVTFAVTPLSARLAVRLGAVDQPRGRGLSERPTPLLGGLAIFAGAGGAMALWLMGGHK
jgi:UDP-GlcNAc:undecaprenyl-phosphate GlcNAc-1-phosphate transferase